MTNGGISSEEKKLTESKDLDELYINTLAGKPADPSESGIGLLLMLKDYNIKLGAQFHHNEETDKYKVIIQTYYYIEH